MIKNKITAVLGPTNTGKTFLAIETMLSFDTGMIGFPLRLLAREVYDKISKKVDPSKVALITGEEKIIPINAKYFLLVDTIGQVFRVYPEKARADILQVFDPITGYSLSDQHIM